MIKNTSSYIVKPSAKSLEKPNIRAIAAIALCAALLFAQQVALAGLPNVHLTALLIMLFAKTMGWRVFYIIYIFVVLQGLKWGFALFWWIPYLYVWSLLAGFVLLFMRKVNSPLSYAIIAGAFGLLFGLLCTPPQFFIGGPQQAFAWFVSGIPFDIVHGAANFALCFALWKPLMKVSEKLRLN